MTSGTYILNDEGNPQLEPDLIEWGMWMKKADRHVAKTEIGDVRVSTVFLGLDHNFGDGPPILWETMVFSPVEEENGEMQRCSGSREQAEAMHSEMVDRVKAVEQLSR